MQSEIEARLAALCEVICKAFADIYNREPLSTLVPIDGCWNISLHKPALRHLIHEMYFNAEYLRVITLRNITVDVIGKTEVSAFDRIVLNQLKRVIPRQATRFAVDNWVNKGRLVSNKDTLEHLNEQLNKKLTQAVSELSCIYIGKTEHLVHDFTFEKIMHKFEKCFAIAYAHTVYSKLLYGQD